FEREARGLGGLVGEDDGARAGVEHHGNVRAVDLRGNRESSAARARDFDRPSPRCGTTRDEFGEHPLADLAQLETIGVSERQERRDHHPDEDGFERVGKTLPKQRQRDQADQREGHDLRFERRGIEPRELLQRRFILLQHEHQQHDGQNGKQDPEQAAHDGVLQPTLRLRQPVPFTSWVGGPWASTCLALRQALDQSPIDVMGCRRWNIQPITSLIQCSRRGAREPTWSFTMEVARPIPGARGSSWPKRGSPCPWSKSISAPWPKNPRPTPRSIRSSGSRRWCWTTAR